MKVCKHCGRENDDGSIECAGCGSTAFSNKCTNCGTVFDSAYCPNCGTKARERGIVCQQCGREMFTAFCPNCGWSPARVQNAAPAQGQPEAEPENPVPKRKKAGVWGFLFALIMPYVAIFFSTFGRLYQSNAARILIAVWNGFFGCSLLYGLATSSAAVADNPTATALMGIGMLIMSVISFVRIRKE